jgi:potassium/hydrogen antiporter
VAGFYPLAMLALSVLAFATASLAHTSGFVAVYLCGVVLGNAALPHRSASIGFAEGMASLAQIGLFVLLGLLASPPRLVGALGPALVVGGALLLVARPLSVVLSLVWFRMPWAQQAFVSWAGLRGAVPIVLATIPLAAQVERAEELFDIVFVMVVIYTLLTGPTLPWVARVLRVSPQGEMRDLDVEAAPLERIAADLLQVNITRRSRLQGVEVAELRLPKGVSVSLVVRDGQTFVPDARTVLRGGDDLLVVTPRKLREKTEERLQAVSQRGRLAHWLERPGS